MWVRAYFRGPVYFCGVSASAFAFYGFSFSYRVLCAFGFFRVGVLVFNSCFVVEGWYCRVSNRFFRVGWF